MSSNSSFLSQAPTSGEHSHKLTIQNFSKAPISQHCLDFQKDSTTVVGVLQHNNQLIQHDSHSNSKQIVLEDTSEQENKGTNKSYHQRKTNNKKLQQKTKPLQISKCQHQPTEHETMIRQANFHVKQQHQNSNNFTSQKHHTQLHLQQDKQNNHQQQHNSISQPNTPKPKYQTSFHTPQHEIHHLYYQQHHHQNDQHHHQQQQNMSLTPTDSFSFSIFNPCYQSLTPPIEKKIFFEDTNFSKNKNNVIHNITNNSTLKDQKESKKSKAVLTKIKTSDQSEKTKNTKALNNTNSITNLHNSNTISNLSSVVSEVSGIFKSKQSNHNERPFFSVSNENFHKVNKLSFNNQSNNSLTNSQPYLCDNKNNNDKNKNQNIKDRSIENNKKVKICSKKYDRKNSNGEIDDMNYESNVSDKITSDDPPPLPKRNKQSLITPKKYDLKCNNINNVKLQNNMKIVNVITPNFSKTSQISVHSTTACSRDANRCLNIEGSHMKGRNDRSYDINCIQKSKVFVDTSTATNHLNHSSTFNSTPTFSVTNSIAIATVFAATNVVSTTSFSKAFTTKSVSSTIDFIKIVNASTSDSTNNFTASTTTAIATGHFNKSKIQKFMNSYTENLSNNETRNISKPRLKIVSLKPIKNTCNEKVLNEKTLDDKSDLGTAEKFPDRSKKNELLREGSTLMENKINCNVIDESWIHCVGGDENGGEFYDEKDSSFAHKWLMGCSNNMDTTTNTSTFTISSTHTYNSTNNNTNINNTRVFPVSINDIINDDNHKNSAIINTNMNTGLEKDTEDSLNWKLEFLVDNNYNNNIKTNKNISFKDKDILKYCTNLVPSNNSTICHQGIVIKERPSVTNLISSSKNFNHFKKGTKIQSHEDKNILKYNREAVNKEKVFNKDIKNGKMSYDKNVKDYNNTLLSMSVDDSSFKYDHNKKVNNRKETNLEKLSYFSQIPSLQATQKKKMSTSNQYLFTITYKPSFSDSYTTKVTSKLSLTNTDLILSTYNDVSTNTSKKSFLNTSNTFNLPESTIITTVATNPNSFKTTTVKNSIAYLSNPKSKVQSAVLTATNSYFSSIQSTEDEATKIHRKSIQTSIPFLFKTKVCTNDKITSFKSTSIKPITNNKSSSKTLCYKSVPVAVYTTSNMIFCKSSINTSGLYTNSASFSNDSRYKCHSETFNLSYKKSEILGYISLTEESIVSEASTVLDVDKVLHQMKVFESPKISKTYKTIENKKILEKPLIPEKPKLLSLDYQKYKQRCPTPPKLPSQRVHGGDCGEVESCDGGKMDFIDKIEGSDKIESCDRADGCDRVDGCGTFESGDGDIAVKVVNREDDNFKLNSRGLVEEDTDFEAKGCDQIKDFVVVYKEGGKVDGDDDVKAKCVVINNRGCEIGDKDNNGDVVESV